MSDFSPEHLASAGGGGALALAGAWALKFVRRARAEGRMEQRVSSLETQLREFREETKADFRELRELLLRVRP